ncbi:ribokinase [Labrys neptuniae]
MAVHVVGNVCVDTTFRLERFPVAGETLNASGHADGIGGKGANQAIAASRTGAAVTLWTTIGNDNAGRWITERLTAENLVSSLTTKPLPTDRSAVLVDAGGENMIVTGSLCAEAFDPLDETNIAGRIASGDVVVMQGNLSSRATAACLEAARRRGARTILNPSPLPVGARQPLPPVDLLVVNEGEAHELTGHDTPEPAALDLFARGASSVVVTLGPRGCLVAEGATGVVRRLPAPAVCAIDTSGAGDVFCGILAGGIDLGMTLVQATSLAIAAAALAVGRSGTSQSCPSAAEIGDLIRKLETEKP